MSSTLTITDDANGLQNGVSRAKIVTDDCTTLTMVGGTAEMTLTGTAGSGTVTFTATANVAGAIVCVDLTNGGTYTDISANINIAST